MVNADKICELIKTKLPSANINAKDLTGTGDHWQVAVVAEEFAGKTLVAQHRMVYDALGDLMKQEIHALALDTSTP